MYFNSHLYTKIYNKLTINELKLLYRKIKLLTVIIFSLVHICLTANAMKVARKTKQFALKKEIALPEKISIYY